MVLLSIKGRNQLVWCECETVEMYCYCSDDMCYSCFNTLFLHVCVSFNVFHFIQIMLLVSS